MFFFQKCCCSKSMGFLSWFTKYKNWLCDLQPQREIDAHNQIDWLNNGFRNKQCMHISVHIKNKQYDVYKPPSQVDVTISNHYTVSDSTINPTWTQALLLEPTGWWRCTASAGCTSTSHNMISTPLVTSLLESSKTGMALDLGHVAGWVGLVGLVKLVGWLV